MPTITQLCKKNCRKKKISKLKTPGLNKNPQRKGVCVKILIRTPKKTEFCTTQSSKN